MRDTLAPTFFLLLLAPSVAEASYSPPLTRVRIDKDATTHTPSVMYASDSRSWDLFETHLVAYGAQYVLQTEWASGFGLQAGAAAMRADLDLTIDAPTSRLDTSLGGFLLGGQLRAYAMLWSGRIATDARPSAATAFVNLRAVYYSASAEIETSVRSTERLSHSSYDVSGGVGGMLELALLDWLSVCPYAWFSPSLRQESRYRLGADAPVAEHANLSLNKPLRVGIDAWIYIGGAGSDAHVALSALSSLFDTSKKGNVETALVLAYTF